MYHSEWRLILVHYLQLVQYQWTTPDVTPGGDHVASFDAVHAELFTTIETKIKPQKWVKKHESQGCDRDKLKLNVVVLHDGSEEVYMTQPDSFAAEDSSTSV